MSQEAGKESQGDQEATSQALLSAGMGMMRALEILGAWPGATCWLSDESSGALEMEVKKWSHGICDFEKLRNNEEFLYQSLGMSITGFGYGNAPYQSCK